MELMKRKLGMTKRCALTFAEVLITLGIIGVVAAMTIPNIVTKYQKQEVVSKLKKANTVLNQMVLRSYADNGSELSYTSSTPATEENTKQFFNTYILPYFDAPNVFPNGKKPYTKNICGTYPYFNLNGSCFSTNILTLYSGIRILFSSRDGIIYYIEALRWDNKYDDAGNLISNTATYTPTATALIDINGLNGPNTFGKDIFRATIDFQKNKAEPYGMTQSMTAINTDCGKKGSGQCCFAKIVKDGWEIKDDYPW